MRYFIEISYKGTAYSGFQIQQNAHTIQSETEKALKTYFRRDFLLTGSSRTDAGVHALQNYFHFDTGSSSGEDGTEDALFLPHNGSEEAVYHLNAILPGDIVIQRIFRVSDGLHCRFDALFRQYKYFIYKKKDPFLEDRSFYYPYKTDLGTLNACAEIVKSHTDFTSFSKRNTQVKNFSCQIQECHWMEDENQLVFTVKSNRFLRGMVKALVGTMLRSATGKITLADFENIIENRDCTKADFSIPPQGLFLMAVSYAHF